MNTGADMWRTAQPKDDQHIIEMCRELNREDPGPSPVPDEHMKHTLVKLRSEAIRGKAVVLELDTKIEGYALLISFWSNELGGELCDIDELYVRPDCRGRGYASMLVKKLIQGDPIWPDKTVAIELGVTPNNSKAKALYSKLGFQPAINTRMRIQLK
jgi:ribosomal protein S18 acetylase RimI-like enzyme